MSTIVNIYSVRDTKADAFGQPFYAPNDAVAYRMIAISARDSNSYLGQDPKSFDLYCLGDFDDQAGIVGGKPPEYITSVQFIIEADESATRRKYAAKAAQSDIDFQEKGDE